MSVTAIIVNYHTSNYLPELVKELLDLEEMERVSVVDNSCEITEKTLHKNLSSAFSNRVSLFKPGKNIGFGAGVNLAAAQSSSEYLLVINPDVRLFAGCLEQLLAGARKYGSVLTGPRFYWDEKKKYRLPPSQGASPSLDFSQKAAASCRLEFEHLSFYWQMRHERFWQAALPFTELFLSGACVLINREWAMKTGKVVFDERFFLYFEDNDISLEAYFKGKPPLCIPGAEALHHYDQSPSPEQGKYELMATSHGEFVKKYYGNLTFSLEKKEKYQPDIHDLGVLTHAPSLDPHALSLDPHALSLDIDEGMQGAGELFFEIGVNPFFMPFAQTTVKKNMGSKKDIHGFTMDKAIWGRLAKGIYFVRLRNSVKGTLKVWRWEKQ